MKRTLTIFVAMILLSGICFSMLSGCKEEKVDPRQKAEELFEQENYNRARAILVGLLSDFPNDKKLMEMKKECDRKIAKNLYEQYWAEAEKTDTWKGWVKAMMKIKKVENFDREMVDEWIDKATTKAIDTAAEKETDGKLLGVLKLLVQRYQVISSKDRLAYLTLFHKEGRFPMDEWKGTFLKNFPELFDDDEKFVGYPKPESDRKE